MKNPKKGKEKKRIGYNYLGMAGIMVIALVLLGSLMLQSKTLERRRIIMIPKLQHWRSPLKVRRNVPRKSKQRKNI